MPVSVEYGPRKNVAETIRCHSDDAVKIEGSLEIRQRSNTYTGDFLRKQ